MFRWIRRLILFTLFLGIVAILLIILFPNRYEKESVIEINAPVEKVFSMAEKLELWNMYAMLSGSSVALKELKDKRKTGDLGDYTDKIVGSIENLNMRVSIVKSDYPKRLVYKIEGGPMSGIEPEMHFIKLEETKTRVIHQENYIFTGLTGSIKAFAVKYGTGKLSENGLGNLKKISEAQP